MERRQMRYIARQRATRCSLVYDSRNGRTSCARVGRGPASCTFSAGSRGATSRAWTGTLPAARSLTCTSLSQIL
jgi:hypothetical protein